MEPVAALLTALKPQPEHPLPLTFTKMPPNPMQHVLVETEAGRADHLEATLTPRLLFTARHAQDVVFERWSDGVLDVLAWSFVS